MTLQVIPEQLQALQVRAAAGNAPNAQLVIHRPRQRIEQARATARGNLITRLVHEVSQLILSAEAREMLSRQGVLNLAIRFQNGAPFRSTLTSQVTASLDSLGEIPLDIRFELDNKLRTEINPQEIQFNFHYENRQPTFIDSLRIHVSNCEEFWSMDKEGQITQKKAYDKIHDHRVGFNPIQTELAALENQYRQFYVDEKKVDEAMKKVFDPDNKKSAFNRLVEAVEKNEGVIPPFKFRIAINHPNFCVYKDMPESDTKFIAHVAMLSLAEIALFFKKISSAEYLGKMPACIFFHYDVGRGDYFTTQTSCSPLHLTKVLAEYSFGDTKS